MNITDLIPAHFPSRYALAKALQLRPSAVYAWKDGNLPPLRVYQVRELLNGAEKPSVRGPAYGTD